MWGPWYTRGMRKKGSLECLEQLRLLAANMIDRAMAPAEIASLLGVDDQTVRRWRRAYLAGGREALALRKPPGRPAKLGPGRRAELVELLKAGPRACGYDSYLWTTRLVARLVREKFGVEHHHDHVGVILHELGLSPQVPARRARERDEAKVAEFREKTWPELLKKVRRKGGPSCSPTRSGS